MSRGNETIAFTRRTRLEPSAEAIRRELLAFTSRCGPTGLIAVVEGAAIGFDASLIRSADVAMRSPAIGRRLARLPAGAGSMSQDADEGRRFFCDGGAIRQPPNANGISCVAGSASWKH